MRLGKQAPKLDHRTLRLARYFDPVALPAAPRKNYLSPKVHGNWGMLANDRLGDCTCAALGHMIQCWSANASGAEALVTDSEVIDLYNQVNGGQDQGAIVLDVLNAARDRGLGRHKILAYAAVDPRNKREMQIAAWLFGGLYLGFNLPASAQGQRQWRVDGTTGDPTPGSWGGHAVMLPDYANVLCKSAWNVVSWGGIIPVSQAFMEKYCDEAYAILSMDWLLQDRAPSGFDLEALKNDLARI